MQLDRPIAQSVDERLKALDDAHLQLLSGPRLASAAFDNGFDNGFDNIAE
jgi:hypothetical protein